MPQCLARRTSGDTTVVQASRHQFSNQQLNSAISDWQLAICVGDRHSWSSELRE